MSSFGTDANRWFAVWVRPRCELKVHRGFEVRGVKSFLPRYSARRRWSDRLKETDVLMFPGYVFCHISPEQRIPVLTTPGVVQLVSFGGVSAVIPDGEIFAIQQLIHSRLRPEPQTYVRVGEKVRIAHGPLKNIEGIVVRNGRTKLIVSIEALQRSVAVEIEIDWLAPLEQQVGLLDSPVVERIC